MVHVLRERELYVRNTYPYVQFGMAMSTKSMYRETIVDEIQSCICVEKPNGYKRERVGEENIIDR